MKNSEKDIEERRNLMREIRDEIVNLKSSPLYAERIKNKVFPVIGEGDHFASIMLVGEAPGRNEAATGRPFCGAAGKILDELLNSVGIDRKSVYVTNIVKDRPPFNRDPLPEEIESYGPFLDRQIEIIKPKAIVTLGRFSMAYIMNKLGLELELEPISKIHGKVFETSPPHRALKVIPLYHPAVAIYNNKTKETLLDDFKVLRNLV